MSDKIHITDNNNLKTNDPESTGIFSILTSNYITTTNNDNNTTIRNNNNQQKLKNESK